MIEIRNIITTDGNEQLEYRYRYPQTTQAIIAYPPEDWMWSDWIDVKIIDMRNAK